MIIHCDFLFYQINNHLRNLHVSWHFMIPFIFLCHFGNGDLINMVVFVFISISIQLILCSIFNRLIESTTSIDHSIISTPIPFYCLLSYDLFPLNQTIHIPIIIVIDHSSPSVFIYYLFPMWTPPLQILFFCYECEWISSPNTQFITSRFKELSTLFDLESLVVFINHNPHHQSIML